MAAKLTYARYGGTYTHECDDVRAAARRAIDDQESDQIYALKIEDENGAVVWERSGVPWTSEGQAASDALERLAERGGDVEAMGEEYRAKHQSITLTAGDNLRPGDPVTIKGGWVAKKIPGE